MRVAIELIPKAEQQSSIMSFEVVLNIFA
jgi:hypothetical protein